MTTGSGPRDWGVLNFIVLLACMARVTEEESDDGRGELAFTVNNNPKTREELEAKFPKVWNTEELKQDFEVIAFAAPFVKTIYKTSHKLEVLGFQHHPRFYFSLFPEHTDESKVAKESEEGIIEG